MVVPRFQERLDELGRRGRGRRVRSPRSIGERREATGVVAVEPLVPRLPTDAVGSTELGHRRSPAADILDELPTQFHGRLLLPRHRTLLVERETWRECHTYDTFPP